ncbi:MAG: hypothetical protein IT364_05365 [Candidatus Hydrogenedentes bacterium]|nr:hypothetical protein [Candidatus Hydrogenedentota bacterium]
MLALPEVGMARSVKQHNIDMNVLCDWIEASIVLQDDRISKADVVKSLIQHQVYDKQDFAMEIVDQAWSVMASRMKYLNEPLGIQVSKNRISRSQKWDTLPAYGFCMTLACAPVYPSWLQHWGAPSVRGELFEELAHESFSSAYRGWTVQRIGWSPGNPAKLRKTIAKIISDLNEVEGKELGLHVDEHANELGLDLLAYYSYGDVHASLPVLLVQCASGDNWRTKRHTPDLGLWRTIVSFNSCPVRGMVMPFAYANSQDHRKHTKAVDGVFVDRLRLLGGFLRNATAVSAALDAKLVAWVQPLLASAPKEK